LHRAVVKKCLGVIKQLIRGQANIKAQAMSMQLAPIHFAAISSEAVINEFLDAITKYQPDQLLEAKQTIRGYLCYPVQY